MKYGAAPAGLFRLTRSQISVYPNPATDKIAIEKSVPSKGSILTITNIEGQQPITRNLTENNSQLDV